MSNAVSRITLCKVPITPTNQIDFIDITAQQNYFSNKGKHTFEKCRYQPRTATIKVKGYVDTLQDCNYGYYTNTYNGTTKTFYFWIVSKDYLAREVTALTIQIDVFQTWLFDVNFTPCMIEREHVDNDTFGKHTIPEDFELGDYITYKKKAVDCLTGKPCFFIGLTDSESGTLGGIFGHTYSGFMVKYYNYNDTDLLNNFITELCNNGKGDSIAFLFSFPQKLLDAYDTGLSDSNVTISGVEGVCEATETFNWNEQVNNFSFNGDTYIPHNAKVYCYPYNFITVKNSSGGNVVLKLENFATASDVEFSIQAVLTQHPTITLTPKNYCGKSFAIDDSIQMSEYGLCSWNNDNFANWFAQNRNSINSQSANATASTNAQKAVANNNYNNALDNRNTNAEKGLINTALSTMNALGSLNFLGATTNAVGGLANNYLDYQQSGRNADNDLANNNLMNNTNYQNTIRSIVASVKDAQVQPNSCKGSTTSCGLDMARDTATFFIEQTGIKPEYARIVDMYFQMFGYQVNTVKKPNFKTRNKWNYVKTVNCSTYGDIPNDDIQAINSTFNNGITIWHDESFMYQYETDNDIKVGV
jgi:hypothetical protein